MLEEAQVAIRLGQDEELRQICKDRTFLQSKDCWQLIPSLVADDCLDVVNVNLSSRDIPNEVDEMLDGRTCSG